MALWFVARYGLAVPIWDDWNTLPVAAGRESITPDWLWSFQMDHRIPIPRLLFIALYRLGGNDVRAIMFVNVLLLSGAAVLGLVVARRRVGRTRLSDAVLPLSLLGIANYVNLVSANQVQYVSSIALFCVVVFLMLRDAAWFTLPTIALLGICALGLPLTGSTGLALALPMMVLFPVAAWVHRGRQKTSMRIAYGVCLLVAAVLVAVVAAYNVFGERPGSPVGQSGSNIQLVIVGMLQFGAVGFAAPPLTFSVPLKLPDNLPALVAAYFSPEWVNRTWRLRTALVAGSAVVATAGLVWPVLRRRQPASSVLAPLCCLACVATLAFAIGYARGSALDQRYITLGATLIFTVYLCLSLVRHWIATIASWALLLASVALLPWNMYQGLSFGEARRAFERDLIGDIQAGVPVDVIGTRYYEHLWGDPALATAAIKEMRDDRIGPFANGGLVLNESAPVVASEHSLSTEPGAVHNMTWSGVDETWDGTGSDSYLMFPVMSEHVAGIRLKYRLSNASASPALLQVAWTAPGVSQFDVPGHTFARWGARADGQQEETVAWIDGPVDMLRITPDIKAESFKLDEIEVLLSN
jgi:hypothetical protein